jgi:NAD-dependent dihydropyrimidine dehydrogenase PreA subunit
VEEPVVLKAAHLDRFMNLLSIRHEVYFPVKKQNQRFFSRYTGSTDEAILGEVRPFEPLKAFFFCARERVAEDFQSDIPLSSRKPFAILGVKACDLKGLFIQDYVFKSDVLQDPFYSRNREQNLIIGADCTCAVDTCFCLALGVQPHPQENFDLNFSSIPGGFVVEAGAVKGRALLQEHASLFHHASQADLHAREGQRARVREAVEQNLKTRDIPSQDQFPEIIEQNWASKVWQDEAGTCVECGACTNICPTCHCFLLYDQKNDQRMARLRVWDSCLLKDYARVAGGANPRKFLWMRLRNRFDKKFNFFPKVANVYACTGCGRCITACPGKIDIRRILRRLVNRA